MPVEACPESVHQFFALNLRAVLFTGCLTVGSFLVAAHTFLIAQLKKEVYDHPNYKAELAKWRKRQKTLKYYGPLRNMSRLTLGTVVLAILSSVLQLTVGLVQQDWAAWVCIAVAISAGTMLGATVILMAWNLRLWFRFLEDVAVAEETKPDSSTPGAKKH